MQPCTRSHSPTCDDEIGSKHQRGLHKEDKFRLEREGMREHREPRTRTIQSVTQDISKLSVETVGSENLGWDA